jgi:hypothetical protein
MRKALTMVITLILISFPVTLFSQEFNVVLETGLGSYRMSDLKEINKTVLKGLPFDAKITNNFPIYWNYKSCLLYSFRKLVTVGITGSYQSTGSRVSRADYSGEYFFDTKIRSFSPGAIIEFYHPVDKFRISFSNEVGIEYSKLGLKEVIRVNTESQKNEFTFTSENYYYEPAVKLSYPVSFFRLGLVAGYLFDLKREDLSGSDSNNYNLILSDGNPAKSDWSGIRLGASLSFNLFQRFNRDDQTQDYFTR